MKMKKILTGLALAGSVGTVATTATVISSCGTASKKGDLTLGIRSEEASMWKPIIEAFKDATGKTIKLRFVKDQQANYALWKGSHLIPDVTITDASAAKRGLGKDEQWFQALDLKDIAENSKWKIESTKYPEGDISFDANTFTMGMIDPLKIDGTQTYANFPVIWGPQMPYVWNTIKGFTLIEKEANKGPNIVWTVPTIDGNNTETVASYNNCDAGTGANAEAEKAKAAASPLCHLVDGHSTNYKLNEKDIQEFLMNAALKSETGFNGQYIKTGTESDTTNHPAIDRVISTGKFGYNQRLFSVAHQLRELVKDSDWKTNNPFALIGDPGIDFTGTIQGTAIFGGNDDFLGKDVNDPTSPLDEAKWHSDGVDSFKFYTGTNASHPTMSTLERLNYFGHLGYYRPGFIGTSNFMHTDNAEAAFGTQKTIIMDGAKWQFGGVKKKAESDKVGAKIEDISFFSKPFSENGIDGYAINKEVTGAKLTLAKQFIRFLMQPDIAALVASNKAVSTVRAATAKQPVENALDNAVKNSGYNWITNNNPTALSAEDLKNAFIPKLQDSYAKRSTENFYDLYNNMWIKNVERSNLGYGPDGKNTVALFIARIEKINQKYAAEKAAAQS